jgi:copper resistance protein B
VIHPRQMLLPLALLCAGAAAQAEAPEIDLDLVEMHFDGDNSFFLDGSAALGSETDKLIAKLTTGGSVGRKVDQVEGQLLYGRVIGNVTVSAGVRHEFRPHPHLTYGVVGIEAEPVPALTLEANAFVSQRGDLLAELKAVYDLAVAPRVVVQPRIALNLAAQRVTDQDIDDGPTDVELGVRLRYELSAPFAPYVGISHERLLDGSRRIARAAGDRVDATHLVIGFSSAF